MTDTPTKVSAPEVPRGVGRTLVRYIAGFGVGFSVGLAPFLGKLRVPGFDALLSLYPPTVRDYLLPLAAFGMATTAVAVTFYGNVGVAFRDLQIAFRRTLVGVGLLFLLLFLVYSAVVVHVPRADGRPTAFIVALQRQPRCEARCGDLSDETCIAERLSFNPGAVDACWGQGNVRVNRTILSGLYLALMIGFGLLTGLLVLYEKRQQISTKGPRNVRQE